VKNPYDVGMTGLIGFSSSGYYAMCDCDVLLMLGTDFPYRQFYPEGNGVRIAQIDIRPENLCGGSASLNRNSASISGTPTGVRRSAGQLKLTRAARVMLPRSGGSEA
jgi:hypothetical protein